MTNEENTEGASSSRDDYGRSERGTASETEFEILKTRLEALEKRFQPLWYLQPSLFVAILALILSFATYQAERSGREIAAEADAVSQIRAGLANFAAKRLQYQTAISREPNAVEMLALNRAATAELSAIAVPMHELATSVCKEDGSCGRLTFSEQYAVAEALYTVEIYDLASTYAESVLERVSDQSYEKAKLLLLIAGVKYRQARGPSEIQKARTYCESALRIVKGRSDRKSRLNNANFLETLAQFELEIGNRDQARQMLTQALAAYRELSAQIPIAESRANEIEKMLRK